MQYYKGLLMDERKSTSQAVVDMINDFGRTKLSRAANVPLTSIDQYLYADKPMGYKYSVKIAAKLGINIELVKPIWINASIVLHVMIQ